MRTITLSPNFSLVFFVIGTITGPLADACSKNSFLLSFKGVLCVVILSKSSKYCQYKAPQATPSSSFCRLTLPISGFISFLSHEVLKYPVPASTCEPSILVGSISLSPSLIFTILLLSSQLAPVSNRA